MIKVKIYTTVEVCDTDKDKEWIKWVRDCDYHQLEKRTLVAERAALRFAEEHIQLNKFIDELEKRIPKEKEDG